MVGLPRLFKHALVLYWPGRKKTRGRDLAAEALALLDDIPGQLGGSGLWLDVAVVPERRPADPPEITPDAAQHFLADWSFAHAPVEAIALGTP
jgi:hypothetical protein